MNQLLAICWDAVAAKGQVARAFFTAIAVAVALYTSISGYTPKVDVQISLGTYVHGSLSEGFVMICSAINIGAIDVKIDSCILKIPNSTKEGWLYQYYMGKLPVKLSPGENVNFDVPVHEIALMLQNSGVVGNRSIKVLFIDSAGRRYTGKIKIDIDGLAKSKSD